MGEKDVTIQIKSPEGPKMNLLVNEAPVGKASNLMKRDKNSEKSRFIELPKLNFGETYQVVYLQDDYLYLTFFSYESEKITIQLSLRSNLKIFKIFFRSQLRNFEHSGLYNIRSCYDSDHSTFRYAHVCLVPSKRPFAGSNESKEDGWKKGKRKSPAN